MICQSVSYSKINLFADDSLVYRKVQQSSDCHALQQDLDSLQQWEQKWQMSFNADKCEVLRITNKRRPILSDYYIHNQKLAIKTDAKYLDVTISSDLSWAKHTGNIVKKANSTMAFLRRNIKSTPPSAKDTAYKSDVRPTLEYASKTWASNTAILTQKIEMVQRRLARFVMNDYRRTSSATAMQETLNWDTLERRREQARLTMMYRILHQLVDIPAETYLTPSSQTGRTPGHNTRFQQIQTRFAGYQKSFFRLVKVPSSCGINFHIQPLARQCWMPSRVTWPPSHPRFPNAFTF